MAVHLSEIDELLAPDHAYLSGREKCYFLREYTSGAGYQYSETNNLISNLKKSPDRKVRREWRYKEEAVKKVASEFLAALDRKWLQEATLVPIPPSKVPNDPDYDRRMEWVLESMTKLSGMRLDVRSLLLQRESVASAHTGGRRLNPLELEELLEINDRYVDPPPSQIALFDDVLTTGAHFVAAKSVLRARFGSMPVVGIFVARRIFPEAQEAPP